MITRSPELGWFLHTGENMSLDYIARCPLCKRIVCWAADTERHREDTAETVAGWIRDGLELERMATEEAKLASWGHADNCTAKQETLE